MEYFWFEAQTGVIHMEQPKAPSNYYRYRLAPRHLGTVKLAVQKASIGSYGLIYEPEFLAWLEANELPEAP